MKGLWVNERTYINFSDKKTNLSEEIATRKRAIDFYSLGMYLPNPDPVLKKQGKDITVYNELLIDSHVGACVKSRKSGVLSLEWGIDKGKAKSRQAKVIESIFNNLHLERIISEILNAVLFGFQVMEVMWVERDGLIIPSDLIGKPQGWFVFDEDNRLRMRTKDNYTQGILLPEKKFILIQYEASYTNPYGIPELSRCFWPVTFKKGGMKFWIVFTEKYGMPFLIGKHPRGTSQTETNRLADILENMIQDAVAVIPDDSSVEIMEAGGKSASSNIYRELIELCNSEISKAILGQTLTTQTGEYGSRALGDVHLKVRKDIIESDKKLVERAINTLIKWIYDLNFSNSELPVFSMWEKEDIDKNLAERDKILTDTGIKFTKVYFKKNYGFDDEDIVVKEEIEELPQQFKEPPQEIYDQQLLDSAISSIDPQLLQKQIEGVLRPIIDLINKGKSYEEIMENLIETYPDMDTKAIEELLARAIFISEIWGRLNART